MKPNVKKLFQTAGLFVLGMFVLFTHSTYAQSSGIGGRPAQPDPSNSRTKSIFVKQIEPGKSAEDAIKVLNNTAQKKLIYIYAVDAVPSSGGAFACAQAVDEKKLVGEWIALSTASVELLPGKTKDIPFTITVPEGSSVGEQNGCIVLQEKKETTVQGGIGLSFRTAIRVAVLVPGKINKQLTAKNLHTRFEKNKLIVSPEVRNTGNVSLDTLVETKLQTIFGTTSAKQENTFPVLRDQLTEWNFEFDKPFWGGFYKASYSLTYNKNREGLLGVKNADLKTIAGQSKMVFVAPQPAAILIELALLVLLVVAILKIRSRRAHRAAVRQHWKSYVVRGSDNIQSIAKTQGISWKKLASSNNLKPPYSLVAGQKIKVPKEEVTGKKKKQNKA